MRRKGISNFLSCIQGWMQAVNTSDTSILAHGPRVQSRHKFPALTRSKRKNGGFARKTFQEGAWIWFILPHAWSPPLLSPASIESIGFCVRGDSKSSGQSFTAKIFVCMKWCVTKCFTLPDDCYGVNARAPCTHCSESAQEENPPCSHSVIYSSQWEKLIKSSPVHTQWNQAEWS